MAWGGLRGGISIALALRLTPEMNRELFLTATYGVVIFSIIVQGLTVGALAKRMIGVSDEPERSIRWGIKAPSIIGRSMLLFFPFSFASQVNHAFPGSSTDIVPAEKQRLIDDEARAANWKRWGHLPFRTPMGHRSRGLLCRWGSVELFHARSGSQSNLPLGRGRFVGIDGSPRPTLFLNRALER